MFVSLAYIAFFLVCSWAIFRINQKSHSLSKSVFIAIFTGAVIGLSLHLIAADERKTVIDWYNVIGNGYVNLLKLVAVPLIFISILRKVFKVLKKQVDYAEYGGAPLIGINGCAIIGHGKSNAKAVKNAIYQAINFSSSAIKASTSDKALAMAVCSCLFEAIGTK